MSDPIKIKLNRVSARLTEDIGQPGARAQLYAAGLSREDLGKPQVGIASTGFESNPCNMHLNRLADQVKNGVQSAGMIGWRFNTIGVSDGETNGTTGMNYSLPSRDLIADSIEAMTMAHFYDANISVVGCDKNMPGALMAMARIDRPSIMVYGGTIQPGRLGDRKLDIVSAFEAYGQFLAKQISEAQMEEVVEHACPGRRRLRRHVHRQHHGGGHRDHGHGPAHDLLDPRGPPGQAGRVRGGWAGDVDAAGAQPHPPADHDRKAFENAIRMVIVLGGSTNAVLHLLAMAHAAGVAVRRWTTSSG